jgi:hypothetical protein
MHDWQSGGLSKTECMLPIAHDSAGSSANSQSLFESLNDAIYLMAVRASEYAGIGDNPHQFDWRLAAFLAEFPLMGFRATFVLTYVFIGHRFATFRTVHDKLLDG